MDNELKRKIILDNYINPKNRGLIDNDKYIKINTNIESCIDEINLMINIEDSIIKDILFDGEACAISTAATSIMIKSLIGKNIETALSIIDNYEKMIDNKEYKEDILGEAICFCDIYKQANRKKCALLSWNGIKKILENYRKSE